MLRDRRPILVVFADKAAVRAYVADRVGVQYLPTAYAVVDDPQALLELHLPPSYVVKPTHGSGAALVVSRDANLDAELPEPQWGWVYRHVRPGAVRREALVDIATEWMTKLYGQGPNREWAYGHVRPQIIVEELLEGGADGIPDDFKFFVFHGKCHFVQVDAGRFTKRRQDFYSPDWEHLPMSGGPPWAEPARSRPDELDEMIDIAERLGAETDFVRVDLYLLPDRIVFGELTSYPAGGDSPFEPALFDEVFGRPWTVPPRYV